MVGVSRSRTREETIMIYLLLNVFHGRLLTPTCGSIGGLRTHFPSILLATCNCANKFTWHWTERCLPTCSPDSSNSPPTRIHLWTMLEPLKHYWKIDESCGPGVFFLAFSFSNYQVSSPNGKIPVKINDLSFFFLRTYVIRVCIYIYILYYVYLRKIIAVPECL